MKLKMMVVAGVLAAAPVAALAQQAKPAVRPVQKPVEPSATVTLSVRGANADRFLTVQATAAEVRGLLRDMGQKADATLYLSPSVAGTFTGTLDSMEPEKALATVAASTGLKMMRINLPDGAAPLTAENAGKVYEALTVLPQAAQAWEAGSKKTVMVSDAASTAPDGKVIYYVQGKLTPDQERAGAEQRAVERVAKSATAASPTGAINSAIAAFNQLPVRDRMRAMQDMQRQMFQNMSPQDRAQLRDQRDQQRGQRWQRR